MSKREHRITVTTLMGMKANQQKIAVLTAYDFSFARQLDQAGVDVVLVGDSLGMVVQGRETTIPVTMDDMVYHSRLVERGLERALLVADLPFMSYATSEQALTNAGRLMKEGGAQMVKLEGGADQVETVTLLVSRNIPVCAHLGLQPQSVHRLGGYHVQGRQQEAAQQMVADAAALESAGASMLVLECVPAVLAAEISAALEIPVIGIGAGIECDGQVLVLYDLLGITSGAVPRFVKNFLQDTTSVSTALTAYVDAVKSRHFPTIEHSFL
ncbi:MAG: 3-methyl-2-oxobutanoate hydroxymethyltransferase [Gammaproteobacteria bacterium]|jgi:3-methyl-2-oxobutanoate hydroxymethyltransferase|nr:3-methyl-2-oxobutanoate hydroxymethyltransferase [Gammaproteobacteria bacterium]MBT3489041.1 3-methyl-2-oxobutanoate hydroxymethyltransferase [Gammaproteobacteria bacterium]MBT3719793.1 3-methyl-2-oxobutanoate hydroxymethyltransferase [Gammaproteobacteria bacterium]MBT3844091.1 3-methyl-2-oxobutanoate hydroxymethyltransferase [Gammaproteobacteria bacterium]MBT3893573.1 3-methyl-2-oxobutanoate hydroxymethyltransferase [Gammaproteobacteria bacterium]